MFLALYFATEGTVFEVAGNDNDPVLADGWYFSAVDRLAKMKSPFERAHEAAILADRP